MNAIEGLFIKDGLFCAGQLQVMSDIMLALLGVARASLSGSVSRASVGLMFLSNGKRFRPNHAERSFMANPPSWMAYPPFVEREI
jgi:hypothetical protein